MLTLSQIRAEKNGEAPPKGLKNWYTKNKGVVLIGGAVVIAGLGYMGWRYIFKKKGSGSSPSTASNGPADVSDVKIDAVEF